MSEAKPKITREEFIKNQSEYCKKMEAPFFMPDSGTCYSCHKDIISVLIEQGQDGTILVTGCPLCFRSYCD